MPRRPRPVQPELPLEIAAPAVPRVRAVGSRLEFPRIGDSIGGAPDSATAKRLAWCAVALVGIVPGKTPLGLSPEGSVGRSLANADRLATALSAILGDEGPTLPTRLRSNARLALTEFWSTRRDLVDARRPGDEDEENES
jgi:hypothetical protein